MKKVSFYAWKITDEAEGLMHRIELALRSMLPDNYDLEVRMVDIASYGRVKHNKELLGLAFGKNIKKLYIDGDLERIFSIESPEKLINNKENVKHRAEAMNVLKKLAEAIESPEKDDDIIKSCVIKNDISIGDEGSGSDIEIPAQTIKYLKDIKELLGGCKIIITKGDIKIEVE